MGGAGRDYNTASLASIQCPASMCAVMSSHERTVDLILASIVLLSSESSLSISAAVKSLFAKYW